MSGIRVLEGVAAIRVGRQWIAWDIYGPVRGTASRTPEAALRKYAKITRRLP